VACLGRSSSRQNPHRIHGPTGCSHHHIVFPSSRPRVVASHHTFLDPIWQSNFRLGVTSPYRLGLCVLHFFVFFFFFGHTRTAVVFRRQSVAWDRSRRLLLSVPVRPMASIGSSVYRRLQMRLNISPFSVLCLLYSTECDEALGMQVGGRLFRLKRQFRFEE